MDRAGFRPRRILLLEVVGAQDVSTEPDTCVVRKIIQAEVAEILLSCDAPVFGSRKLIAVFEEPFTECIELWWRRVARRAVQRVFPRKGGNSFCGLNRHVVRSRYHNEEPCHRLNDGRSDGVRAQVGVLFPLDSDPVATYGYPVPTHAAP